MRGEEHGQHQRIPTSPRPVDVAPSNKALLTAKAIATLRPRGRTPDSLGGQMKPPWSVHLALDVVRDGMGLELQGALRLLPRLPHVRRKQALVPFLPSPPTGKIMR